jgi:hypothetical protein
MNDSAFTISVTWHEIEGLLKQNGVKVTDEMLNWAQDLLMKHRLFSSDLTRSDVTFREHCIMYLSTHPECEA